jgi:hypothetical protein
VKYEESNRIHKRMIELSQARGEVKSTKFDNALYRLQTNDPLWHGVFGGLYLPNLRDNAYRFLVECENIRYKKKELISSDQNELDGYEKIKAVTNELILRFDAAHGGQLIEFDNREACFNWQNSLTRRKEAYHQKIFEEKMCEVEDVCEDGIDTIHNLASAVDESLKESIIYDWYLKNSFIDHISDRNFSGDNFKRCSFYEYGDFANQPFEVKYDQKNVKFSRDGGLYFPHKENSRLDKNYHINKKGFDFEINFSTDADGEFRYVLEHNFHFAEYDTLKINGELLSSEIHYKNIKSLEILDAYLKKRIIIKLDMPFDLYYFTLETLSQSEKGLDLSAQAVSFAMVMPFSKKIGIKGSLEVMDV